MFKTVNGGQLPTRGSKYSACVDLYASEDVTIGAGETKLVGLGVCIDLESSNVYKSSDYMWATKKKVDEDTLEIIKEQAKRDFMREHYLQLMLRSSLGVKGLILPNGVGIIDLDYEDEIKMIIHNPLIPFISYDNDGIVRGYVNEKAYYNIKKGDRIGQITLLEHKSYLFGINTDDERSGGFGSTGGGKS